MTEETKHSDVDAKRIAQRTATRQVEQQDRLDGIEPIVIALDARTKRIEQKLDRVLAMPRAVQYAAIVASVALMVIAYAAIALASR